MSNLLNSRSREVLSRLGTAGIANILLAHGLRRTVMRDVSPLAPAQAPVVGPAFTLRFIPSREDLDSMKSYALPSNMHRRAIEECPAGSILVIDSNGSTQASSMGDLMALRLRQRGVAGVVTDGGFRDTEGVVTSGLSCFQQGNASPPTPIAFRAASLDEPIGCGGVAVYPGDIIVGNSDGVAVIPQHLLSEVVAAAERASDYEQFAEREIRQGRSILDVLPPTSETRAQYEEWVSNGRPREENP